MSRIEDRLTELGLTLPNVSKPVAAYVPAIVTGNLVYTAGQLPMVDGKLEVTGKVGAAVSPEDAESEGAEDGSEQTADRRFWGGHRVQGRRCLAAPS